MNDNQQQRGRCPHEDDITYGKAIDISDDIHAVHILCEECGAVGTQIEHRDTDDSEHWQPEDEMWHEPSDYRNSSLAKNMVIKLTYKGGLTQ